MSDQVDLYSSTYGNFQAQVLAEIRRETYGKDIGQNSWITTDELDTVYEWLNLSAGDHVLEIASGSGGPALYLAQKFQARITGIDINEEGIKTANRQALDARITDAKFQLADVTQPLPFDNESFDAVMCMDSMNHFRDRPSVLQEWYRVLREGRRILFTDPVVITGPVSNEELAARSSIGFFLFVPLESTKNFVKEAGFRLIRCEDVTQNVQLTSGRWHASRQKHREDLIKIEGQERFEGLQKFLSTVHSLSSERRLSRFVFLAEK
ncbi:MAG TPA: methyltransferase domain-containing protein [Anaerolineales bacterium]|nr:methyltransferase domain-containing protein [Anaerolineales bacterium]